MKKGLVLVLNVVILFGISGFCLAQLPFGKKEGAKVDVEGLSARSIAVMTLVRKANISFAEGVIAIQEASGRKEQAEKLKQIIANVKSKPDQANTKVLISENNTAAKEIEENNVIAQIKGEEAQKLMGKSCLNVGVGVLLDGIAADNGAVLLNDAQAALKQVSFMSAGKVKDVVAVGQFVSQEVPPQVRSMKTFSEKLFEYAKTNGIPVPAADDLEKISKEKLAEKD